MDFLTRMFSGMFRQKKEQYTQRAVSRVRANTVGKVQAKVMKATAKMDQKVNKAQDNVLKGKFKGDGGPKVPPGASVGGPPGGGGAAAPLPAAARSQQQQGAMPRASVTQRAAGAAPPVGAAAGGMPQGNGNVMGKGKRNKNQAPMGGGAGCHNCGNALQPDWEMCPYCGAAQGAAMAAMGAAGGYPMQPGFGPPQPVAAAADDGNHTMAVDLSQLQKKGQPRPVVGWIVAQNGNHRGQDFRLFDGKNVLGTAADCDIVITDPYLSAKHCTIRHEEGNFVLIDLDSTNGTFVNQKRVSKMELIDNDTVRFGRTEFKFKALF